MLYTTIYLAEISLGIPLGKNPGLGCMVAMIPGILTTSTFSSNRLESERYKII